MIESKRFSNNFKNNIGNKKEDLDAKGVKTAKKYTKNNNEINGLNDTNFQNLTTVKKNSRTNLAIISDEILSETEKSTTKSKRKIEKILKTKKIEKRVKQDKTILLQEKEEGKKVFLNGLRDSFLEKDIEKKTTKDVEDMLDSHSMTQERFKVISS